MSSFPLGEVTVGDERLSVWVADESPERRQGLMDLESLPGGIDGMLFAYPTPRTAGFHMRNTLIDLDIWWFDPDMRLVGSAEMEPCAAEPCTTYASPGEVRWVLETPLDEYEFEPGERLSIVETG